MSVFANFGAFGKNDKLGKIRKIFQKKSNYVSNCQIKQETETEEKIKRTLTIHANLEKIRQKTLKEINFFYSVVAYYV